MCVSCDGPRLASRFAQELKLSECTVTYTEDDPAWGQLGCSGFIVLDGTGHVTCRATAAYLEDGERAFDHVESLLDALRDGAGEPPPTTEEVARLKLALINLENELMAETLVAHK